ncbi:MAG TPA: carboxypeptidase regulatory-like domain-containing protein [Acidobacteriaceae bacterium]|nr:carboxypeptidase regulatory-like domain-containing protein [Acidobacteriaceae bacterium]
MKSILSRAVRSLLLVGLVFAGLGGRSIAQGLGSVTGTVVDSAGAVVPSATVTLTQTKTGAESSFKTTSDGLFSFPSVSPADYRLDVTAPGFKKYEQAGITVLADQRLTLNVGLQVGSEQVTVNVEANAAQLNISTQTMSQVIGQQQVNELPLNGRNAAALTTLVAGVVIAPNAQADQGNTKTFPVAVTITANGARVGQTNYLLDGGNNVDEYTNVNAPFPMPDAVQEFSVQTSNYNAEYGQNAGGVVNIITRSGGNTFHGNLFEFVRNRAFNAANYFAYVKGVKTVDPLKRNQFGGTIGGPIVIPGLFHTNHSFFFFGYQKTILHTAATSASAEILPTPAQLAGNFNFTTAAAPGTTAFNQACVANPALATTQNLANQCYPYVSNGGSSYTATIPTGSFNSASVNLLKYLPKGDANGNFAFVLPNFSNQGEVTARFDQDMGASDWLTARYFSDGFHQNGVLDLTNLLTYTDQANIHYYNALVSEAHTFSSRLLNNFILSYQLEDANRGPLPGSINVNDLGVNIWQPAFKQINQIQVSGFFTMGGNPQADFARANYTLGDDLHWQLGNHNLAFGFHGEVAKVDVNNAFQQPGLFTFNANVTNNAVASFLLGYLSNFSQASGQFLDLRGKFVGVYAQDSWKVGRRFTLNYGLRYEPFLPWHENQGRMGSFFPSLYASNTHSAVYPLAPAGLLFAGDANFNPNGVPNIYSHVMPRMGFAWDVFGNGKTSVRAGAGDFFDSRLSSVFYNIYSNTSPFITNFNVSSVEGTTTANSVVMSFSNPYSSTNNANPFPAPQPPPKTSPIPPQAFLTYDPYRSFQTPISYAWNLAVEQQVTRSLLTRVAYVAGHSSHQWSPEELNPIQNADALPTTDPNYNRRVYNKVGCLSCYTQPITEANMGSNSNYDSLQISAEQRLRTGLTVLANYTWSKALDDTPYNQSSTAIASNNSYVLPIYEPNFKRLDYGPSDFNHTNVTSISFVYVLPKVMQDAPGALRYAVNGWQASGLLQTRSGDPLTVLASSNNSSGSGQSRDRAVYLGGNAYGGSNCPATAHCKNWLNSARFTANPAGTYGNVAKGSFTGPRYTDVDMSIARDFPFTERAALQFRAEYFNLFNHTNFGDPNVTLNSTFGEITSTTPQNGAAANDPRIAQFSLKLNF